MEKPGQKKWRRHASAFLYGLLAAVATGAINALVGYISSLDIGNLLFPAQTVVATIIARVKLG